MRILLVTRGFPPKGLWGSEGYSHDLAKALVERGNEVAVFYPVEGKSGVDSWATDEGIRVQEVANPRRMGKPFRDSYRDPRQEEALAKFFEQQGEFDRVHFTALGGGVSMGLLPMAGAHAKEVLVTLTELLPYCHRGQLLDASLEPCTGPEPSKCSTCVMTPGAWSRHSEKAAWKRLVVRILSAAGNLSPLATRAAFVERERYVQECFDEVSLFLAPSEGLREQYLALGMPAERMRYLPYALDPDRYSDYRPREQSGPLRLAYLAQLAPHKGVQILIEALGRLEAPLRKRLHLTLHGSATSAHHPLFADELRDLLSLTDLPIEAPGPFPPDQVARVLSEADVVVLPSLWLENLPLVLLHARACGLPILASDVGGIRTFIRDGEDGWLIEPTDVTAWAQRLETLARAQGHESLDDDARAQLRHVQEGARQRGIPMPLPEHVDTILSLERLLALPH